MKLQRELNLIWGDNPQLLLAMPRARHQQTQDHLCAIILSI